eukprot:358751-Chlamydomonas_euryale.AAC.7
MGARMMASSLLQPSNHAIAGWPCHTRAGSVQASCTRPKVCRAHKALEAEVREGLTDAPQASYTRALIAALQQPAASPLSLPIHAFAQALHFYQESHRVFPVNMDVISWLGAYHVKNEVYEKAVPYFDLASRIQPQEVKWGLMVASCYRRIGSYPQVRAQHGVARRSVAGCGGCGAEGVA